MRRTAAAVVLTVIGLWLVLSFKSSPVSNATAPTTSTAAAAATPSVTRPVAGGAPPDQGSTTTTTTVPPKASAVRTVTGDVESNNYGEVQVAVVLNGARIVDVQALRMPTDRARSAEISSRAAPLLRDEAIGAQSAQIDTVSGATYTSGSYAQSLQSALDRAHA